MNENTTKGEKMDKEWIAELRRRANAAAPRFDYSTEAGKAYYISEDLNEALDALEAALARAEGVVALPGICEDDIDELWKRCEDCPDPARAMAVEGYKLAESHLPNNTEPRP